MRAAAVLYALYFKTQKAPQGLFAYKCVVPLCMLRKEQSGLDALFAHVHFGKAENFARASNKKCAAEATQKNA